MVACCCLLLFDYGVVIDVGVGFGGMLFVFIVLDIVFIVLGCSLVCFWFA